MIRNFELFCNLNRISSNDFSLLNKAFDSLVPHNITCPTCGAEHSCSRHAQYLRDFICHSGSLSVHSVAVPRLICSSCGHTHAFLPGILIPHASYSLFFILKVLRAYFLKIDTIAAICQQASISASTLYHWLRLFSLHKQLWLGILKDNSTGNNDFLSSILKQPAFPKRFFQQFRVSFLQNFPQRRFVTASGS